MNNYTSLRCSILNISSELRNCNHLTKASKVEQFVEYVDKLRNEFIKENESMKDFIESNDLKHEYASWKNCN